MNSLDAWYGPIKALHIIFMVSWFAGLFYMPRLMIYHTESQSQKPDVAAAMHAQFSLMEKRLANIIMTPAMILTIISGLFLIKLSPFLLPSWTKHPWMHIKLVLVLMVVVYHLLTERTRIRMSRGTFPMTSLQLRMWNEAATLLLVGIVFLVVLKSTLGWIWGVIGFVGLGVALMMAIKLVNRAK